MVEIIVNIINIYSINFILSMCFTDGYVTSVDFVSILPTAN